MSKFEFVSHQDFPDDEYTKELVYLEMNVPARVGFVRKKSKTGGMFWSTISVGIQLSGKKEYFDGWMQDSNFLEKDIKNFLDGRGWEKGRSAPQSQNSHELPSSMSDMTLDDGLPF